MTAVHLTGGGRQRSAHTLGRRPRGVSPYLLCHNTRLYHDMLLFIIGARSDGAEDVWFRRLRAVQASGRPREEKSAHCSGRSQPNSAAYLSRKRRGANVLFVSHCD